jgi:dienelactone hydrolase
VSAVYGFAVVCFALAALASSALAIPAAASADELVKFDSASAIPARGGAPLQGYLTKPKGEGPFPAVILLHSCLGLPANRQAIGEMFAGWGFVSLFVDDFATRGLKETCSREFGEAVSDAFGGMAYLSTLPFVDARRIAAVGYSQGGDTALQIASNRFASAFATPRETNFKAAVALYPPCANQANVLLEIPTLILIGKLDEVTPAADCERFAKAERNAKLAVYPGASHLFDDPGFAKGKRMFGMWLKYDADAAAKARAEMRAFLSAKLGAADPDR